MHALGHWGIDKESENGARLNVADRHDGRRPAGERCQVRQYADRLSCAVATAKEQRPALCNDADFISTRETSVRF